MLKIVRNDLVRMDCEAIVNTANSAPVYSSGVDTAVYEAAGAEQLLAARQKIGHVAEGEVFATDAYNLPYKKIIHAVSPRYIDGLSGEEDKLRACYSKSLAMADALGIKSIAFPLIATGSFGYPIAQGMNIAVEEINEFLENHDMLIYLVVFGSRATDEGKKYKPDLESFIENRYVDERISAEYGYSSRLQKDICAPSVPIEHRLFASSIEYTRQNRREKGRIQEDLGQLEDDLPCLEAEEKVVFNPNDDDSFYELEEKLNNRLKHIKDTFSEYLMYLIEARGMTAQEVYNNSIVTKKLFSKIKTNPSYHPSKEIALRLCVGAKLNIDDSKDLLARAGYTFSPCELYDMIFEFFIENEIFDIVEIAIQLEEHGLPSYLDE